MPARGTVFQIISIIVVVILVATALLAISVYKESSQPA